LFHLSTKKNLHSHHFQSPLSNNQEVSAFGDNGDGDESDNWVIECDDDFWRRDAQVRIKHQATNKYLHVTGDSFGRPIHGQLEVSATSYANSYNLWQVNEGMFIKPNINSNVYSHSEL
jgi:dolichyl-phosphate-mannose--protein O-mannosyl transferase